MQTETSRHWTVTTRIWQVSLTRYPITNFFYSIIYIKYWLIEMWIKRHTQHKKCIQNNLLKEIKQGLIKKTAKNCWDYWQHYWHYCTGKKHASKRVMRKVVDPPSGTHGRRRYWHQCRSNSTNLMKFCNFAVDCYRIKVCGNWKMPDEHCCCSTLSPEKHSRGTKSERGQFAGWPPQPPCWPPCWLLPIRRLIVVSIYYDGFGTRFSPWAKINNYYHIWFINSNFLGYSS